VEQVDTGDLDRGMAAETGKWERSSCDCHCGQHDVSLPAGRI